MIVFPSPPAPGTRWSNRSAALSGTQQGAEAPRRAQDAPDGRTRPRTSRNPEKARLGAHSARRRTTESRPLCFCAGRRRATQPIDRTRKRRQPPAGGGAQRGPLRKPQSRPHGALGGRSMKTGTKEGRTQKIKGLRISGEGATPPAGGTNNPGNPAHWTLNQPTNRGDGANPRDAGRNPGKENPRRGSRRRGDGTSKRPPHEEGHSTGKDERRGRRRKMTRGAGSAYARAHFTTPTRQRRRRNNGKSPIPPKIFVPTSSPPLGLDRHHARKGRESLPRPLTDYFHHGLT